jgi:hypothetical protein
MTIVNGNIHSAGNSKDDEKWTQEYYRLSNA